MLTQEKGEGGGGCGDGDDDETEKRKRSRGGGDAPPARPAHHVHVMPYSRLNYTAPPSLIGGGVRINGECLEALRATVGWCILD